MAVTKGTGGGVRYDLGNISAPWLVIPGLLGIQCGRALLSSVLGGLAAALSVAAFYATTSQLFHMVVAETARNNLFFLIAGAFGGALFSMTTGALSPRHRTLAACLVGALFVAEPAFTLAYKVKAHIDLTTGYATVAAVEIVTGILVFSFILTLKAGRPAARQHR